MLLSPADDLKSLRDERDELLKDRDSLQEEVDSFRTALVRSRKESEEAKKRVLSLSAKNRILEEQLSGLLSKIDFRTQGNRTPPGRQSQELRDENASLKTRLVKEISEKDDTKQQLGAALQKVSEMQSLLKQENSSKAELKKQLLNAQEQVQLAESRLQAEVSTMNGLKAIIRKREQTLSEEHDANMKFSKHLKDLENDISLMRARELSRNTASQGRSEAVKISEAENQRLKAELQSSKKAAADKEKVLLSELADLRQENNKMKGENMSLREKIHKFEIRNTQLQTAYGRLEENYQAEQKAKKAIEAQRPGLLSQTEVLRHDNEAMKKQIAHLTAEKAIEEVAQHARYQEILKEKSVLSQELEDREALVKEQQSIIWRTQTELNTMETGLNSLKLERDNALNEAEQLRIRARQHGEEQLRLQQILADRNTRLQTTYAEAQDVAKLLQESKQRLEKEMQDRAQSQAQMEMVLTAKSDEITTLRTSVKDLNTRLNAEVTQAAKLNQAQTQLRSDLKARSIEMTALRARFNELQAQQLKEADKLRSAQDVEDDLAQLEAHYGTLKEAYQELDCAYGKMVENRNSYHDLVTRFFKATAEHMSRECAGLMGADWFAVDEATREAAARALGRPRVQTEQGPEAPEAQSGPRETLS
ncbi:hypothetical protein NKR23_g5947 [Pleurostoma richardsiae]|uniref:Uncharacterized protein n=1 Tax=Pleurostoma richardsiae TaxID=41990 RepID=A0AA38RF22_9PEZI|nr:hypothetical protein NKR23_g5947 [Pleurostoma richardsiae]